MSWTEIASLVAAIGVTGVVAGLTAGMLGVGGGIVIVPVLFTVFGIVGVADHVKMHLAVGTSLSTIVWTSISSMWAHHQKKAFDLALLRSWALWIFLGAVCGAILAGVVSGNFLKATFALIAFAMSLYMFATPPDFRVSAEPPRGAFKAVSGFAISGVSALMGIGGGTIFVPFFNAFGVPIHKSVGTSAGIGLLIALPATAGFVIAGLGDHDLPFGSFGNVSLLGTVLLAPISMATAPLGARIAHWLSPLLLKRAFAAFLLITAIRMAISLM
jgi:uncharacterized membrane protein YfcA